LGVTRLEKARHLEAPTDVLVESVHVKHDDEPIEPGFGEYVPAGQGMHLSKPVGADAAEFWGSYVPAGQRSGQPAPGMLPYLPSHPERSQVVCQELALVIPAGQGTNVVLSADEI